MNEKIRDEYYVLTENLDEIDWALDGNCNDIDCDHYMHKDLLKKKYKPVLKHGYSCVKGLRRDRAAVMRLLSMKKFRKYRFEKCAVCKKLLDKLDKHNKIVGFTKPIMGSKYVRWEGVWTHKGCASKFKVPEGWKRF